MLSTVRHQRLQGNIPRSHLNSLTPGFASRKSGTASEAVDLIGPLVSHYIVQNICKFGEDHSCFTTKVSNVFNNMANSWN